MSCTTTATINACEEGVYKVSFILQDESDNVVVPNTIYWQLSDNIGTVINENTFASNDITGTQETITIDDVTGSGFIVLLQGDDLAFVSSYDDGKRIFAIKATYDSSLGSDLPFKSELSFTITNLVNF